VTALSLKAEMGHCETWLQTVKTLLWNDAGDAGYPQKTVNKRRNSSE